VEAPELGRGGGGARGEGASATSKLGPAGGGRRGGLRWDGAAAPILVRGGGAGTEGRRRQTNWDGGRGRGGSEVLEVRASATTLLGRWAGRRQGRGAGGEARWRRPSSNGGRCRLVWRRKQGGGGCANRVEHLMAQFAASFTGRDINCQGRKGRDDGRLPTSRRNVLWMAE
jgi:hypothetical protein